MSVLVHALMPAAGLGSRSGQSMPKQYALLAGEPVIVHALRALLADTRVVRAWVVLSPEDTHFEACALAPLGALASRVGVLRCGGASRGRSVANGLAAASLRDEDWVLVHDAARPCLPPEDLAALIEAGSRDAVGAILASPVADTLKRGDPQGRIAATVDRTGLWAALTPQMFRCGALRTALAAMHAAGLEPTDEAAAFEHVGQRPVLVPGSRRNLKITWPDDFQLAEALLERNR